jgi:hypothetical protein
MQPGVRVFVKVREKARLTNHCRRVHAMDVVHLRIRGELAQKGGIACDAGTSAMSL